MFSRVHVFSVQCFMFSRVAEQLSHLICCISSGCHLYFWISLFFPLFIWARESSRGSKEGAHTCPRHSSSGAFLPRHRYILLPANNFAFSLNSKTHFLPTFGQPNPGFLTFVQSFVQTHPLFILNHFFLFLDKFLMKNGIGRVPHHRRCISNSWLIEFSSNIEIFWKILKNSCAKSSTFIQIGLRKSAKFCAKCTKDVSQIEPHRISGQNTAADEFCSNRGIVQIWPRQNLPLTLSRAADSTQIVAGIF